MSNSITQMLGQGSANHSALVEAVYPELRKRAARHLRGERPDHTLQATALANEAWFRLARIDTRSIVNRSHFFALASRIMSRILKDHARTRNAQHNCGSFQRTDIDEASVACVDEHDFSLMLENALARLEAVDARLYRVVKLRFIEGLTESETAEALGISVRTVRRDWKIAQAWLRSEISPPTD